MMRGLYFGTGQDGWRRGMTFDVFGVGSAVSGIATAAGTVAAANIQADATNKATALQQQRYETTRGDLLPYQGAGQDATSALIDHLPDYAYQGTDYTNAMSSAVPTQNLGGIDAGYPQIQSYSVVPGKMTQAELEATPGYQWARDQGIKATQSSAAARGLGVSGAALKGAATYATGLADNTYTNQFNQLQTQFADQLSKDNQNYNQWNTTYNDVIGLQQARFNQQQQQFADVQNVGQFDQNSRTNAANRLLAIGNLGESAAAQTGAAGSQAATASGNYLTQGAQSQASTISNGTNNLVSGLNSYLNSNQQNSTLNKLLNGNTGTSGTGAGSTVYGATTGSSYDTSATDQTGYNQWGGLY